MVQIFITGDSFTYGVGADNGGWADLVKNYFHQKMYSIDGVGEKYEIFNFGKSGEGVDFVKKTFPEQLEQYSRGEEVVVIISAGTNDIKATNESKNFISMIEECLNKMNEFLDFLISKNIKVIVVGSGFFDESKTNPKINPFDGSKSYFTNDRQKDFLVGLEKLCKNKKVSFVDIGVTVEEWKENYLYVDGLHPNQNGHNLISKKVLEELNVILG